MANSMSFGPLFLDHISSYGGPLFNFTASLRQEPTEDQVLNGIWIGLVGLESLIVLGVILDRMRKALSPGRSRRASLHGDLLTRRTWETKL